MQSTPETLDFNSFDDDFFASLENEIDVDIETIAREALYSILTITDENDHPDYETIKEQTERFFANPLVIQDMQLLNTLAMDYVLACQGHSHDATDYLNDGPLSDIHNKGSESLENSSKNNEGDDEDDYEFDPITGKKRKKRYFFGK